MRSWTRRAKRPARPAGGGTPGDGSLKYWTWVSRLRTKDVGNGLEGANLHHWRGLRGAADRRGLGCPGQIGAGPGPGLRPAPRPRPRPRASFEQADGDLLRMGRADADNPSGPRRSPPSSADDSQGPTVPVRGDGKSSRSNRASIPASAIEWTTSEARRPTATLGFGRKDDRCTAKTSQDDQLECKRAVGHRGQSLSGTRHRLPQRSSTGPSPCWRLRFGKWRRRHGSGPSTSGDARV